MFDFLKKRRDDEAAYPADGPVLHHADPVPVDTAGARDYGPEITAWMEQAFPGRETTVWHELASPDIHVDVYAMAPIPAEPYWVLYTTGMSSLPMTLENLGHARQYDYLRRAEVMMYLPGSFPLQGLSSDGPEEMYWPIRILKALARMPHLYRTWLGAGHSVPNGNPARPIAGTGFTGVVLFLPDEGNGPRCVMPVPTRDGGQVMLYLAVPVYPEEMDVKLRRGAETLEADLRLQEGGRGFLADPARPNTSPRKEARP